MFYSSIFVTAMMLDAKSKQERRREREKQIEAVKAEVLELKEEEMRILQTLSRRWKPAFRGPRLTSRHYSTLNDPAMQYRRYQDLASRSAELRNRDDGSAGPHASDPGDMDVREDPTDLGFQEIELSPLKRRALQTLAMKMLGLRLLLRPSIAHSYGSIRKNDTYESVTRNLSVEMLLSELEKIRKRIFELKHSSNAPYLDICGDITLEEQEVLERERDAMTYEFQKLFGLYEQGRLSLDGLALRVSELLISSQEPLSPRAIEILITSFSRAQLNDMVKMVMDSLFTNTFLLTVPIIVSSLNWFNKTKDLSGFDQFLKILLSPNPFVNIHLRWGIAKVGGLEIAVPPNSTPNPFILNSLISCALCFDQPQRADAWLDTLRAIGFNDTVPVLGAYLRYHSFHADWRKGRHVLMRVIFYLLSSKNHPVHEIERLVLYMIILCECCGRKQVSDSIIAAAVSSGIRWQRSKTPRDARPVLLWAARKWRDASIYSVDGLDNLSPGEKYVEFARKIEPLIREAAEEFIPDDDLTLQRLRLEESFNMKYYKLISNEGDKSHQPVSSKDPNEQPRDDIESTKAELKKLQGMVNLQNAVIAKLEGYILDRPEMRGAGAQSSHGRSEIGAIHHKSRTSDNRSPDKRYRLVSIFNSGDTAMERLDEDEAKHPRVTVNDIEEGAIA
ncbi:hypothetical protein LOZ39_000337 [Ophidiomyces ophidiicola]|nr:hypothetical protein LOZ61_000891 [Ophidiomyces ophidiicola]KAI1918364.1 hypothetical protein LOZ64_002768 [Ophidiomyces ophidiicola]KAI1925820.1 hypothetical protein LOZ60_003876 [Ophidiomyces ophidiicola]KAI1964238.1 hypothetical protein LOZ59_001539 [Ophidiomyces ophidiicola]KAI2009264.1 hypothetical protein LOZ50_001636 [Ophidiomyces ophidiicola]